jgi:TonB-linked SusC/RagA family outer membrane protein
MKKKLLFILLLTMLFVRAQAQTRQVSGTIKEKGSKESIPAVSVTILGTTTGTQSNNDGEFKLTVPDKPGVILVFKSVGYSPQQITLQPNQSIVNVTLAPLAQELSEVVAIGYATVKRKDLAGAVTSVSDKDLKDVPSNSLAEALAGRLAGVQVTVSQGAPGADADINVRGRNSITQSGSPLFIVDGVQVDNAINVLSPQDIASIDVLKDAASTAIYGSRGSNGVILITTKGGKNTNGRISVNFNGFAGVQKLAKELPTMNPYDFISFQYDRFKLTNDSTIINRYTRVTSNFDTIKTYKGEPGIDWQKKMFGRSALMHTENFSLSGGTDKNTFNLSVTNNGQQGILLGSDYKRQIVNFRFDQEVSKKLKVGFNVRYNKQVINGAGTSDAGGSGSNNLRQIVRYPPFLTGGADDTAYDPTLAGLTNGNGLRLVNPLQLLPATYRQSSNNVFDINTNINYNIVKNVSFRSVVGYDVYNSQIKAYNDTLNSDAQANLNLPTAQLTRGQVITINNSNVLTYSNPSFLQTRGSVTALAGIELYQTDTKAAFQNVRYFPVGLTPDQAFANFSLASPPVGFQQPAATSSDVPVRTFSYFSRLNYTYDDKYIATFTIRADGSSIFGPSKKWGYFPSGSFAWRVIQEKFMRDQSVFSDLKLRLSYGAAGNNRITPYSYDPSYAPGKPYYLNGAPVLGLAPTSVLNNPDLQWETLVSKNVGLDMSFLKGRIQLTVDAYINITNNLLINNVVPVNTGYSTQFQNVGSTQNKGLEFTLSSFIIQSTNFRWSANFNIAFNRNTIRSLGSQSQFYANSGWFGGIQPADYIVKVGDQVGTMYGLVNDGYYKLSDFNATPYSNSAYPWATTQYTLKSGVPTSGITSSTIQPGTQKFKDINGDGIVNGSDFTVIGHALPKFTGGLNQTFNYKNFDLSLFLNFSYGGQVYNDNKLEFTSAYSNGANLLSIFNDRWHIADPNTGVSLTRVVGTTVIGQSPEAINAVNGNAKYWIPVTGVEYNNSQSFAVENASFIRINNLTIGYTFPKVLLGKLKLTNFRVYATGNNLGVITGYSGYDPEVSTRRSSPLTPGVDYSAYPRSRTYLMGINISF